MAAKTTKPTDAAAPKATRTAAEILKDFEIDLAHQAGRVRRDLARQIAQKQEAYAKIAACLEANADAEAVGRTRQLYEDMDAIARLNGKLGLYLAAEDALARFKAAHESPADAIAAFREHIVNVSLADLGRYEHSSSAFSNAMHNAAGDARGSVYRELADMAKWQLEAIKDLA